MSKDRADAQEEQNADAEKGSPPVRLLAGRNRGYRECSHVTCAILLVPARVIPARAASVE
jgi:hypothetical protein